MDQSRFPRLLINLLFILVILTFLAGTLRAFYPVQANSTAVVPSVLHTPSTALPESESETSALILAAIPNSQTDSDGGPASTPVPEEDYITDMTGIIGLGIIMVVVVLVGVAWGVRDTHNEMNHNGHK